MLCRHLFVFCAFSLSHCLVCPSIYGFWKPFWYPQTFALTKWLPLWKLNNYLYVTTCLNKGHPVYEQNINQTLICVIGIYCFSITAWFNLKWIRYISSSVDILLLCLTPTCIITRYKWAVNCVRNVWRYKRGVIRSRRSKKVRQYSHQFCLFVLFCKNLFFFSVKLRIVIIDIKFSVHDAFVE